MENVVYEMTDTILSPLQMHLYNNTDGMTEGIVSPRGEEIIRIRSELLATRSALAEKEEKMSKLQSCVDSEVQELTEKLFQEAYKMVNTAEEKREKAEKLLNESRLEVEMLRAEVAALKELIQAPGMGRNHFENSSPEHKFNIGKIFNSKKPKEMLATTSSSSKKKSSSLPTTSTESPTKTAREEEQRQADAVEEVDPVLLTEFETWRDNGHPSTEADDFIRRCMVEDVRPCMLFDNSVLGEELMDSIMDNRLELEPINEDKPAVRICALTRVSRFCPYRVRSDESSEWSLISLLARNRIAAVCDFFTCLRYLRLGILKTGPRDTFFHVVQLRKNMALAKLGLGFVPKSNVRPTF